MPFFKQSTLKAFEQILNEEKETKVKNPLPQAEKVKNFLPQARKVKKSLPDTEILYRVVKKSLPDMLEDFERFAIMKALEKHSDNQTAAAKELGISKQKLAYRIVRVDAS